MRERFPRIGGFLLAVTEEPQSTRAWDTGAAGEQVVGARLDSLTGDGLKVLHDRRIPRTRANIDHVVVSRAGVFVVDAKKYKGQPGLRVEGGLFRPRTETLVVGGRDCSNSSTGCSSRSTSSAPPRGPDLPVAGVLCFVAAEWPLFGGSFEHPRRARPLAETPRPGRDSRADDAWSEAPAPIDVASVHARIARAFPPA